VIVGYALKGKKLDGFYLGELRSSLTLSRSGHVFRSCAQLTPAAGDRVAAGQHGNGAGPVEAECAGRTIHDTALPRALPSNLRGPGCHETGARSQPGVGSDPLRSVQPGVLHAAQHDGKIGGVRSLPYIQECCSCSKTTRSSAACGMAMTGMAVSAPAQQPNFAGGGHADTLAA
jgi:hypothetical protein